jgi:hypothetical protein
VLAVPEVLRVGAVVDLPQLGQDLRARVPVHGQDAREVLHHDRLAVDLGEQAGVLALLLVPGDEGRRREVVQRIDVLGVDQRHEGLRLPRRRRGDEEQPEGIAIEPVRHDRRKGEIHGVEGMSTVVRIGKGEPLRERVVHFIDHAGTSSSAATMSGKEQPAKQ